MCFMFVLICTLFMVLGFVLLCSVVCVCVCGVLIVILLAMRVVGGVLLWIICVFRHIDVVC